MSIKRCCCGGENYEAVPGALSFEPSLRMRVWAMEGELQYYQRTLLSPLWQPHKRLGLLRADDRRTLNGIGW